MKKFLVFLLCLLMAVSAFGVISASAEETSITEDISALVTFNGYSVKTKDYNGIRAEFELDTSKLEALKENYDVKIGMLFAMAGNTAPDSFANYEKVTVTLDKEGNPCSEDFAVKPLYDSSHTANEGYVGKISSVDGNMAKFFYTVTFDGLATPEYLNTDLYYRLYVILTDHTTNATTIWYVDCKSSEFNYAVSLYEVAKKLVDLGKFDNPLLRSALSIANGNYEKYDENRKLLGKPLSAYSIVVDAKEVTKNEITYQETLYLSAARACADAFEKALGVGLPVRYDAPDDTEAYINIVKDTTLGKYDYKITAKDSVITVSASTVPAAAAGCEALAKAIAKGEYTGTLEGKIYSYPYDSLYVPGAIYQIDFFDSKASMGNLVGGTFGNSNYYNYVSTGFIVASNNTYFDDYIIGEPTAKAYGGTMQIKASWTHSDKWLASDGNPITDWERSQTQYVYRENKSKAFQSKWQDKYLELGFGTVFELANIKNKFLDDGSEYTLQLVASLNGSEYYDENGVEKVQGHSPNTNNFMLGMTRIRPTDDYVTSPNKYSSNISFGSSIQWNGNVLKSELPTSPKVIISERDISTVNEYLVSISGYHQYANAESVPDNLAPTTLHLGVNAADYFVKVEPVDGVRDPNPTSLGGYNTAAFVSDGAPTAHVTSDVNFKIGYNMNTHLYALRVYGRVLSEDEIIQNHFADIAKYFKLDLTDFNLVTNDKDKNEIYALAAGYTLDSSEEDVNNNLQLEITEKIKKACESCYTVTYGDDDCVLAAQDGSFELPVPAEIEHPNILKGVCNIFVGYKDANNHELVTDASGKSLDDYNLKDNIKVEPKYEIVNYSDLYVKDHLMYHVSFLHAKEGAPLKDYGAAENGESAYSAYELYEAEEANGAFYMESFYAYADTPSGDYYNGAPTLQNGFLRLGRNHEVDGKFVSTPLRFSFNIEGTPAYYNSDYSIQLVSSALGKPDISRIHNLQLGDFTINYGYNIKNIESISVVRDGVSGGKWVTDKAFSKSFFQTETESSYYVSTPGVTHSFVSTDAVTYTNVMDKYMEETDKIYIYKDEDYGGTNTEFDGREIACAGRFTLKSYFGNYAIGGVKEIEGREKNIFKNNDVFTIAEGTNYVQLKDGINFYAFRYYNDVLEPADIDQNNFADIAYAYLLDITAYLKAEPAVQTAVHTAFANKTIVTGFDSKNSITKEAAQKLLDDTLAAKQTPAN